MNDPPVQRAIRRRSADLSEPRRMEFRIGVNLGDVMVQGDDLFGDGVNVAARLQEIAAPASICISDAIREEMQRLTPADFDRFVETTNPYTNSADREHLQEGLRKAGSPQ